MNESALSPAPVELEPQVGKKFPKIQVFILTYERPELFSAALSSVLNQDYPDFEVVVSDNSKTDRTQAVVSSFNDNRIIYRRRIPSLPPMEHFNRVLDEVSADYFMLFHDDDIMKPDCLASLMRGFAAYIGLVAVGGNATMIFNRFVSSRKFICASENILIKRPSDLVRRYFTSEEYAPFPSYLYYRPSLNMLRMKTDCGKHADVIFLAQACGFGPILMLNKVVMQYRLHQAQDTAVCRLADRRALVEWACNNAGIDRKSPEVRFYRLNGLIEKVRQLKSPSARLRTRLFFAMAVLHL
ncbi:MAG: glycosyltransferase family A protein, partial [Candidatus Riflebacteria bacterium]|nr:glycosyltransferase family A protein [Candidatus Riflebacteria bacterium]